MRYAILAVMLAVPALAQSAQAPQPVVFHATDYALAGGVYASHLGDWASTEECIRRPYAQCHEAQLPNALVHNKVGFAAYEFGTASLEVFGQYWLTKHRHRTIARIAQSVNVGITFGVDAHNYVLATRPSPVGYSLSVSK